LLSCHRRQKVQKLTKLSCLETVDFEDLDLGDLGLGDPEALEAWSYL